MARRACRKDQNHDGVCAALEAAGWRLLQAFHVGNGWPDVIACRGWRPQDAGHGRLVFCEIKNGRLPPSRRQLTPDEVRFRQWVEAAGLEYCVLLSAEDAAAL